jgi:hypothetical protein
MTSSILKKSLVAPPSENLPIAVRAFVPCRIAEASEPN